MLGCDIFGPAEDFKSHVMKGVMSACLLVLVCNVKFRILVIRPAGIDEFIEAYFR